MTAINLFCQGGTAFMATDTATTEVGTGLLLSRRPKVLEVPHARMAMCWTGVAPTLPGQSVENGPRQRIRAALLTVAVDLQRASQAAIMAAMPAALRAMHSENVVAMPDAEPELLSLTVAIALWCRERGPMVVIGNSEAHGPLPAYAFARVRHFHSAASPDCSIVPTTLGREANVSDPSDFDARKDALALLEAQRRICETPSGLRYHTVGGRAILTEVSRRGVTSRVLRRWPDALNQPIRPEA